MRLECLNREYLGIKIGDIWIEGSGSDHSLLRPEIFSSAMCFTRNNQSGGCNYIYEILKVNEPIKKELEYSIYPNPASNTLNSKFFEGCNYREYKIWSLNGELIRHEILDKNFIEIENLQGGIYFLQLIGGETTKNTNSLKAAVNKRIQYGLAVSHPYLLQNYHRNLNTLHLY